MNTGAKVALTVVGGAAVTGGVYYLATRPAGSVGTGFGSLFSPGVSGAANAGGSKANASGGTVSLTAPSSATVGSTVTLTAQAANITNPVYQFWYQEPTGTYAQDTQGYSSTSSFSFVPSQSGTYRVIAYARPADAPGNETAQGIASQYEANSDVLTVTVS